MQKQFAALKRGLPYAEWAVVDRCCVIVCIGVSILCCNVYSCYGFMNCSCIRERVFFNPHLPSKLKNAEAVCSVEARLAVCGVGAEGAMERSDERNVSRTGLVEKRKLIQADMEMSWRVQECGRKL